MPKEDPSNPAYPEDNEKIKAPFFRLQKLNSVNLKSACRGGFSVLSLKGCKSPEVSAKCPPLCVY